MPQAGDVNHMPVRFDPVIVSGAAGFIGFHVAQRLLLEGRKVVGIDNLNDYYDPGLKRARLDRLGELPGFDFVRLSVEDHEPHVRLVEEVKPRAYVHLAAQAGVRHSIENPRAYLLSNVMGFGTVLEACRNSDIEHLVYASSSSVYGANVKTPFSTDDEVDHPVSLYAATKKSNELMAHTYSHLYGLSTTGLRFFTVYGPWGRPDMALFKFAKAIIEQRPIDVYNFGDMRRDFTYIDDIVDGVVRVVDRLPSPLDSPETRSVAPYKVYNIGASQPVELMRVISLLEETMGSTVEKNLLPMQPGDVLETYADTSDLAHDVGFAASTPIEVGIPRFVDWYRSYYKIAQN